MTKNVLAFDLGASSGRGMLARFDGEKITLEEVHRFPHNFSMLNGHAYWNLLHLMDEMKNGLRKSGKDLSGVGFDTWGVDCGFLSREGDLLAMPGSYRDPGLDDTNMREALIALHPNGQTGESTIGALEAAVLDGEKYAFGQTGIASLAYNTIYKLYYMKKHMPSILEQTDTILMMPNLIEYLFSGVKHTEYSIASTSQLYNMEQKCWAKPLLDKLQFDPGWFTEVDLAGRDLGTLCTDVAKETKQRICILYPGTGTRYCVCGGGGSGKGRTVYIFVQRHMVFDGYFLEDDAYGDNIIRDKISNEGTSDGGYRPTVNIIGLWMQQEIRRNFAAEGREYTFPQLAELAAKEKPLQSFIRPDDFMQPGDYRLRFGNTVSRPNQPVPQTDGALVRCILESLALKYKQTYLSLKPYITWEEKLYIVGGGVQNELLNQYTANALGIPVITGTERSHSRWQCHGTV